MGDDPFVDLDASPDTLDAPGPDTDPDARNVEEGGVEADGAAEASTEGPADLSPAERLLAELGSASKHGK